MNIAVILRQVPDLIEPLEIHESQTAVDLEGATFLVNEPDDQALEQALLIRDRVPESRVTVVALDFGEIDTTLFTAAAKGADRIVKIAYDEEQPPAPKEAAAAYVEVLRPLRPDLLLVGGWAHDELESALAPLLAARLQLPYVGVVRGVHVDPEQGAVTVLKEFPAAAAAKLRVVLPAVVGIVGSEEPPRYVPVSRIRAAQKTAAIETCDVEIPMSMATLAIDRLSVPESGAGAEILTGSDEEVAARVAAILREKGVLV